MVVNIARVRQDLESLAGIGRWADGGLYRLVYTPAELEARAWLKERMSRAGLEVRVDPAGNIIGRLGTGTGPALVIGSHLDTVPGGGAFDGALGLVAGLEVARAVQESSPLRHPLEVIAFSDEEQARFLPGLGGARAMALGVDPARFEGLRDAQGVSLEEAMAQAGLDLGLAGNARRDPATILAYLELHVEQGPRLDEAGIPIGVVEGIVGITRYGVTITGESNHAGTTPMDRRRDALVAACELVLEFTRAVKAEDGHLVGNVGRLKVRPGAPNIVPGQVDLVLEIRCLEEERLHRVLGAARALADTWAGRGLGYSWNEARYGSPCPMDEHVQDAITRACASLGIPYLRLLSWAGHDAQFIGRVAPAGMIFVPSRGGISHSPEEYTSWEDVARGVRVLYTAALELDRQH
ncbi:MAG: Zn-dependent hydrolase [Bacillota bacterium]